MKRPFNTSERSPHGGSFYFDTRQVVPLQRSTMVSLGQKGKVEDAAQKKLTARSQRFCLVKTSIDSGISVADSRFNRSISSKSNDYQKGGNNVRLKTDIQQDR